MAATASPGERSAVGWGGSRDTGLTVLVALAGIALYVWHAAPTIRYWDAAERALVALQLGLSHPTGCVLHAVLGKAFLTLVPLSADYAANLLSALTAGLALGVAYRIARHFSSDRRLCFGATLVLGTSALYWSQAIYSEVYATHFLFFALFMLYYIRWLERGEARDLIAASFVYSVGLGIHMSHVLLAPWILVGVMLKDRSIFRSPKMLLAVAGAVLLGLSWIAAIVIRGKTYWLIGTSHRPDTPARLLEFLSGAQFAWARHPPAPLFAKRAIGCVALLFYSFLGVGVLVACWGWLRTVRRHAALAILASAGTLTYILYFSDNSSSDVGTLILPCFLFVQIYIVIGCERLASTARRRRAAILVIAMLAAVQWIAFPPLGRAAAREARRIADTGTPLDDAGTLSSLFWEGVLKAKVTARADFSPWLNGSLLARTLDRYRGPKALIVPWEIQTVLAFYQATEGWPRETRLYEIIDQHRFYRPESGSRPETFEGWREVIARYAGKRPVLLLSREPQPGISAPRKFLGPIWFDQQYYYMYEILGPK